MARKPSPGASASAAGLGAQAQDEGLDLMSGLMRRGACRYCHGTDHAYHWTTPREFLMRAEELHLEGRALPSNAGGFGYRRDRPPHPDCPECAGAGLPVPDLTALGAGPIYPRSLRIDGQALELQFAERKLVRGEGGPGKDARTHPGRVRVPERDPLAPEIEIYKSDAALE